ncbi:MAG: amidophosphoribosyltransferase [Thermoanaerobaculia bacterium]|nr:amidophosphoribosyltransferase [Thermoanaerobaculia bacterium]
MCGIFGIESHSDAANLTYLGLYALQHRGQESAGLASWDGRQMRVERGMGEVREIFPPRVLTALQGERAIGHTRYSTAGRSMIADAQPVVVMTAMGPLAIVHNGNLANAMDLRHRLEQEGSIFQTSSDTEVILHLMAKNPREDVVDSLMLALSQIRGAYSLLLLTRDAVIAARDPWGFRPLIEGELTSEGAGLGQNRSSAACFASETCALDLLGARKVGELQPGEVVVAREGNVERRKLRNVAEAQASRCAFEHVYFARPDSEIFGDPVSEVRTEMGRVLAREQPVEADLVSPVPDSGLFPALGFADQSGIPFEMGLIRNHYVGRTFIQPKQEIRDFGVRVKLNPVRRLIEGQRVVLVDDSIVRGTTSRKIVRMVREAGAREVHLRISSPPTQWPCHYGIDTPRRKELIAAQKDVDEICAYVEADSLGYMTVDGMLSCLSGPPESYCTACWSGGYRVPVSAAGAKQGNLFPILTEAKS